MLCVNIYFVTHPWALESVFGLLDLFGDALGPLALALACNLGYEQQKHRKRAHRGRLLKQVPINGDTPLSSTKTEVL